MPEVKVTRVPQPLVQGTPAQKNLTYQTHNLDVALSLVPGDDTLVLKYRPDVIVLFSFPCKESGRYCAGMASSSEG
jgi:hypothetical protein